MVAYPHAVEPTPSDAAPGLSSSKRAADYTVAQCLRTTARIVSLSLAGAGLSQRAAADAAGVSRCLVEHWCEEGGLRSVPLSRVLVMAMTSRRGRDAAIAMLTSALSHVQLEAGPCDRDLRDDVLHLAAETGEVSTAVREALADGLVTDDERRRIAAELQDVERVCASMRAALARGGDHG